MDNPFEQQARAKDAEIERLKAEVHRLKRDLVDAVQNIQAHSMIVDASEKDAEIERLKSELVKAFSEVTHQRTLITELCDALTNDTTDLDDIFDLIQRARKAAK